jgi:flagellar hook protein FlgE
VQTQTLQSASTDALREAVVHIDSSQSFAAQARVVHTQDDLLGTLLDVEV